MRSGHDKLEVRMPRRPNFAGSNTLLILSLSKRDPPMAMRGIELSLRVYASMRGVSLFLRARAV